MSISRALVYLHIFLLQLYYYVHGQAAQSQQKIDTLANAVKIWEEKHCIFPDNSLYNFKTMTAPSDPIPVFGSCYFFEQNNTTYDDLLFKRKLCTSFYELSIILCQDSRYQEFESNCLNPKALASITSFHQNKTEKDVCLYVSELDSRHKQYDFMRDADRCRRNCIDSGKNRMKAICELYASIIYQLTHKDTCSPSKGNSDKLTEAQAGDGKGGITKVSNIDGGSPTKPTPSTSVMEDSNKFIAKRPDNKLPNVPDSKPSPEVQAPTDIVLEAETTEAPTTTFEASTTPSLSKTALPVVLTSEKGDGKVSIPVPVSDPNNKDDKEPIPVPVSDPNNKDDKEPIPVPVSDPNNKDDKEPIPVPVSDPNNKDDKEPIPVSDPNNKDDKEPIPVPVSDPNNKDDKEPIPVPVSDPNKKDDKKILTSPPTIKTAAQTEKITESATTNPKTNPNQNDGDSEEYDTPENSTDEPVVKEDNNDDTEPQKDNKLPPESEKDSSVKNEKKIVENEEEKPLQETVKVKGADGSVISPYSDDDENPGSGHFLAYFLTAVVICISGYVIYHNKQKILAFIIEGRNGGRGGRQRSKDVKYTQLKSNVEEVMPSLEQTATSKNFVY